MNQKDKPLYKNNLWKRLLIVITIFSLFTCHSKERLEGFLYLRLNSDITTLDPAFITDVSSAQVAAKIHRGLVRLGDDLNVISDIAKKWEISGGGKVYSFYLSKDAFFSNSRKVTAYDFEYSYKRIMDAKTASPNRWVFERVESVKAIDENIFQIILKAPFPPFLTMLTMPAGYVVAKEDVERWGGHFGYNPSCTGNYCLKIWYPSREIVLESNKSSENKDKPKGIVYRVIPEDLTAVVEFEVGNIDILGIPASAFSHFIKGRRDNIISVASLNTYYLGMNTEKYPFSDKRVRRAVALAIDREKILETFMQSRGRLAQCVVPEELRQWGCESYLSFKPQESKRILKSLGINTITATMYVTPDQDVVDLAEIIQYYLSNVGIHIKIKQIEWTAFKESIVKGEADLFWLSWWADYPHSENFLFPLFHSQNIGYGGNRTRYSDKDIDNLLDASRTYINTSDTIKTFRVIENKIIADTPMIPFWHKTDYIIVQPWVKGVKGYPVYNMDRADGISISLR